MDNEITVILSYGQVELLLGHIFQAIRKTEEEIECLRRGVPQRLESDLVLGILRGLQSQDCELWEIANKLRQALQGEETP